MEILINAALLALMVVVAIGVVRLKNLFAVVVLTGVYSFLLATLLVVLDAVDVAMTEAAVGAGMSTVLMLGALHLTKTEEAKPVRVAWGPLVLCLLVAGGLIYGFSGLPEFGASATPVHLAGPDYLVRTLPETGIPNVVTAVLASYRGFDTLGETTVIFTAGIAVLMLLKRKRPARH
jgi:multicomponent Na+:H+ antiporter subunit B